MIEKKLAEIIIGLKDSDDFVETWKEFMQTNVLDSHFTIKDICVCFYGFGLVYGLKESKEKKK